MLYLVLILVKLILNLCLFLEPLLRISLGGGGTDLPSYYSKYGGFFISAAIDKYTYVSVSSPFVKKIILKYSNYEEVDNPLDIKIL